MVVCANRAEGDGQKVEEMGTETIRGCQRGDWGEEGRATHAVL